MKVKELKPMLLDAVVAKCLGLSPLYSHMFGLYIMNPKNKQPVINDEFSSLWDVGGPVLDHMRLLGTLSIGPKVSFSAIVDGELRVSECEGPVLDSAMRCFAEVMHGENVSPDLVSILQKVEKFENS